MSRVEARGFTCTMSVKLFKSFHAFLRALSMETVKWTPQHHEYVSSATKVGRMESHAWASVFQLTNAPPPDY